MKITVKSTSPIPYGETPPPVGRQERRLALILFALLLGVYGRTLAPGLLFGDSGEFQFAAWRFGLAHPTGYPLYLLLGGSWQHLAALVGIDPAASLNAFSAVLAAVAVSVYYLAVLGWLSKPIAASVLPVRIGAFVAALLVGINPTLWSQALVAEVYALHALFIALFLFLTGRYSQAVRQPSDRPSALSTRHFIILSSLLGFSFTHHRTTLFLLPGLLLWLFWQDRQWWQRGWSWAALIGGLALPQLLYLYIPLRSGMDASPWLYPRLGAEILALYTPTIQGFVEFVTGSVFAVSFLSPAQALVRLPIAANLWLVHFTWPGLGLVFLGLGVLIREQRWLLLHLTLPAALLLQIFNLFYGIGDIYVYYVPLYLIAALWAAAGIEWLIGLSQKRRTTDEGRQTNDPIRTPQYALWFAILILLPASLFITHVRVIDQSGNHAARAMWDAISAAPPPDEAILISNDRNEIVPLYYVQAVESQLEGLTGLFPLLTSDDRFADVGAVTATALAAGERPVYLVKAMPGLEARFVMEAATPPLVRVVKPIGTDAIAQSLDLPYGPLTLLGYSAEAQEESLVFSLFWRVNERMSTDYTTSVQFFDATGNRMAQDDRPPGGLFYPTSLWKPSEVVRDSHPLSVNPLTSAARVQILLYTQPGLTPLAPALEIVLP